MGKPEPSPTLKLKCPECQKSIKVPTSMRGRSGKCPGCGTKIKIPTKKSKPSHDLAELPQQTFVDLPTQQPAKSYPTNVGRQTTNVAMPSGHPSAVQVNVTNSQATNSLGIASLTLGILSLLICWIPLVGFGFSGLGLLLGIAGFAMALFRKGTGVGYAIAGSAVCTFGILLGIFYMLVLSGMGAAMSDAVRQVEEAAERARAENLARESRDGGLSVPRDTDNAGIDEQPNKRGNNGVQAEDKPGEQMFSIGQTYKGDGFEFALTGVNIEKPKLSGFGGDDLEGEDEQLIIRFKVVNTDPRRVLNFREDNQFLASRFQLRDDVDNVVRGVTYGFSAKPVGALTSADDIAPETTVDHLEVFSIPLPKTEYLILTVDMECLGGSGDVKFKIPAEAYK